MGLIDDIKTNVHNLSGQTVANRTVPSGTWAATKAEQGFVKAQESTREALLLLGKTVYEKEKDNKGSAYAEDIKTLGECLEKEKLWHLYSLSLDEKTMCDSCGAVITADSVFCNKCGASVPERDFTAIGIGTTAPAEYQSNANVCPNCGQPLSEGAEFCEKCGTKISKSYDTPIVAESTARKDVCPKCGAPLVEGAEFCEKCGTKIEGSSDQTGTASATQTKQNVCPRCGASLLEDAVFCEKCGAKVSYI